MMAVVDSRNLHKPSVNPICPFRSAVMGRRLVEGEGSTMRLVTEFGCRLPLSELCLKRTMAAGRPDELCCISVEEKLIDARHARTVRKLTRKILAQEETRRREEMEAVLV